jgi:4-oxalomesaconate tautomerase
MQIPIPTYFMRGGTSRGPFFRDYDLPSDITVRDKVLLAAMGSPDINQIDGLGGAHPLTSKVGIVRLSNSPTHDLEFLFAQLQPNSTSVDTKPNCGNMLAAVVPFALESGMIKSQGEESTYRVLTLNTNMLCDITVKTPNGQICYEGDTKIDGVPGTSAAIAINFLNTAGSVCDGLLPTGSVKDVVQGIHVTCIDNGMPMVLFNAADKHCTGYETPAELNQNVELKARIEQLRLATAVKMGLGDVSVKNYPKMVLISAPRNGGAINTRCFIPHVCHESVGVLGAITIATACILPGSVTEGLATIPSGRVKQLSVEHPSGELSVEMEVDPLDPTKVIRSALLRTARLLMRGEVMISEKIFKENK